jgi:hypothetical protein
MNVLLGMFASSWVLTFLLFLGLAFLVICAAVTLFRAIDEKKNYSVFAFFSISAAVVGIFWFSVATTFVVNPASSTVVTYSDGSVDSETFQPGLHPKPLIGASFIEFASHSNYQWCPDFTPSIQSGVEVKLTVCYRFDASKIAWRDQYLKWHADQNGIFSAWRNEIAAYVALATKDLSITDLRSNRVQVAQTILDKTNAWSETSGVPLSSAVLSNWDFTNPDVGKQYDAQVAAGMKTEALAAERAAAEQDRGLQLYQADTYAQVLSARAQADHAALLALGLPNSQWSYYLINYRLMSFLESAKTPNIVVTVGGQGQSPFVYPTNVTTDTLK